MDEKMSNDLINRINRLAHKNPFQSLDNLATVANEIADYLHEGLFHLSLPFTSSTKLTNDKDCRYDFETRQIYFPKTTYSRGNVGEILFGIVHEAVHHFQNTMIEKLQISQNKDIRALAANLSNMEIRTDNGLCKISNYFDPPSKVNYGGFIATGELCYKMQPMERQARFLTFEVMHTILKNPLIDKSIKNQIKTVLKNNVSEIPLYLRREAKSVRSDLDFQEEINKILLSNIGERQPLDRGIVETFLKAHAYLSNKELNALNVTLESEKLQTDTFQEWDEFRAVGDVQTAKEAFEQPLSEWEVKILNTLLSNKDWDKELDDWERNERCSITHD